MCKKSWWKKEEFNNHIRGEAEETSDEDSNNTSCSIYNDTDQWYIKDGDSYQKVWGLQQLMNNK